MYGLQEILSHTADQRRAIEAYMDDHGSYAFADVNLYHNQKRSVTRELRESIRAIPLQEFLVTGLAGASDLLPTKLSDVLYEAAVRVDLAPLISVIPIITDWVGSDLTIDIIDQYSLVASEYGDGGLPSRTPNVSQATISPITFGVPLIAETSILEDSQFALAETYARIAARSLAIKSNDLILNVLKTATDGVGTVNSSLTGDAAETKYQGGATSDIETAWRDVGNDKHMADTLICTPEAWMHSISETTQAATMDAVSPVEPDARFDLIIGTLNLNVLFSSSPELHLSSDTRGGAMTDCVSLIFDRDAAIITGRKRWLQLDNYAQPKDDLAGAVVSARQDSVTAYNDAIYVLTET